MEGTNVCYPLYWILFHSTKPPKSSHSVLWPSVGFFIITVQLDRPTVPLRHLAALVCAPVSATFVS
jgi:hypothetical protein